MAAVTSYIRPPSEDTVLMVPKAYKHDLNCWSNMPKINMWDCLQHAGTNFCTPQRISASHAS